MHKDATVNDKNNANSRTNNFPALRYKYVTYHMQKATLHYTTQFSGRNDWRQKKTNRWKSG